VKRRRVVEVAFKHFLLSNKQSQKANNNAQMQITKLKNTTG